QGCRPDRSAVSHHGRQEVRARHGGSSRAPIQGHRGRRQGLRSRIGGGEDSKMSVDWNTVRCEFPALRNWAFLNTATFGQLPRRATAAVARHFAHRDEQACWDFLEWFDDMDRLRAKAGRLIHCESEDIAFVPNAATALGILLGGLDWRAGDKILTLE